MKVLIIEDEKTLAASVCSIFKKEGFETEMVHDGLTGLEYAKTNAYDLIILDVMLPGLDGFSVAASLRVRHITTPILMLTARSEINDRVTGLNSGADYYLTKPFDRRELIACANMLLRRIAAEVNYLNFGNTSLNMSACSLECKGKSLRLSSKEYELAKMLFSNKENNISKEQILIKIWGFDSDAVDNNVEVYVGFLRKKLASLGSNVTIKSIRRVGYHLEESAQ